MADSTQAGPPDGAVQAPGEQHDQEHGDVDGWADALGWSIVPAGLWDLAVAAETWQTGAAPYRPGVVL